MEPVRWGVISTARIGTAKVLPGMRKSPLIELRAIASRTLSTAQSAAADLGIPKAYGSYEELLADPEIEAVYIPLPNHLHVPLTLQAARAGKHVLCEKPIALTAAEAEQLKEIDGKVLFAEAFMVRFHPQWLRAREIVRSGAIGELRAIQVFFSYFNADPANVRNQADIGGGALYDIGCYPIAISRFLFEAEPRRAIALVERDREFRTDILTSALVDFGGSRQLSFSVATQLVPYQRVQICGTKGRVEIRIPFNAPPDEETKIVVDSGSALDGSSERVEVMEAADQYRRQGEAFSRAVRGEQTLPYGVTDAIAQMRVIDALFRSEKSERWEPVGDT